MGSTLFPRLRPAPPSSSHPGRPTACAFLHPCRRSHRPVTSFATSFSVSSAQTSQNRSLPHASTRCCASTGAQHMAAQPFSGKQRQTSWPCRESRSIERDPRPAQQIPGLLCDSDDGDLGSRCQQADRDPAPAAIPALPNRSGRRFASTRPLPRFAADTNGQSSHRRAERRQPQSCLPRARLRRFSSRLTS